MTNTAKQGLGSDNMNKKTKHDIQSEGGKASHSGGQKGGHVTTSHDQRGLGSKNMDPHKKHEIQSEGGKASHASQE